MVSLTKRKKAELDYIAQTIYDSTMALEAKKRELLEQQAKDAARASIGSS